MCNNPITGRTPTSGLISVSIRLDFSATEATEVQQPVVAFRRVPLASEARKHICIVPSIRKTPLQSAARPESRIQHDEYDEYDECCVHH